MHENWFWKEITTGIAIGVTVATIAGVFKILGKWYRNLKQKRRIRKIIGAHVTQIRKQKILRSQSLEETLPSRPNAKSTMDYGEVG